MCPGVSPHIGPIGAHVCNHGKSQDGCTGSSDAEQPQAQAWGVGAILGTPCVPHLAPRRGSRQALSHQKNKVYFPSGCMCTTSARGVATSSPPGAPPRWPHTGPLLVQPRGAGTPLPSPAPHGQPRPREHPPTPLPAPGPVSVLSQSVAQGSAAATLGEQLPPSPLRSLGLACAGSGRLCRCVRRVLPDPGSSP